LTNFESGGLQVQFLELSMDGLLRGEYELYLRAEEPSAGAAEVQLPLKITF
jgi:hypothetical protein